MHPPITLPQEFSKGNVNIVDSNGPLFRPSLPHAHTFVVTRTFMQMLTTMGFFERMPSEDPHAHNSQDEVCVQELCGRPDLDMNVIMLRVVPVSLMEEAAIWFTKFTYNSIYTLDQLKDVFRSQYYSVSKKLNNNNRTTLWHYLGSR